MMTWSKDLQLSPVAEETEAGSVPVLLKPKSVEDTCNIEFKQYLNSGQSLSKITFNLFRYLQKTMG